MDLVTLFDFGDYAYSFDADRQVSYQDNFADMVQEAVRLVGMDGAFDAYRGVRSVSSTGNVQLVTWLRGVDVPAQISGLRGLAARAERYLFKQSNGRLMFTPARVSYISTAMSARAQPHKQLQASVNFQARAARWFGVNTTSLVGGVVLDNGFLVGAIAVDRVAVSAGSTVTVTNAGNAPASALITWACNASGHTITNPALSRTNEDGVTVDRVTLNTTLSGYEEVLIDGREKSVVGLGGVSYYEHLSAISGAWLEVPAGTWTLTVSGTFQSNALLSVEIYDTYI